MPTVPRCAATTLARPVAIDQRTGTAAGRRFAIAARRAATTQARAAAIDQRTGTAAGRRFAVAARRAATTDGSAPAGRITAVARATHRPHLRRIMAGA